MDEYLARINRIYPNSGFVHIAKYNPTIFEGKKYDSSLDSKVAINKWKTQPLTYEEAQNFVEKGDRIGWIIPEGYVVIDIDNKDDPRSQEYLLKLLDTFEVKYSYNYSSKGVHILLKDPTREIKSDSRTKCGLNIEIDTRANKTGYIVLPCNDPHRAWGCWDDFVEDIPYFLKPMLKDSTPSFIGMQNGDGRNDALIRWRFKLMETHKMNEQEIEKTIRIINQYIFDTPLPNNELCKTVLRDLKDKEKKQITDADNKYNKYADELLAKDDLISYYSDFYRFNGIYYEPLSDINLQKLIHFNISQNISSSGRREIVEFLKMKTQVDINDFNKDWYKIAVKNGILNLVTGEVEQPNKTEINTIYIPYNYNKDPVYSSRIDNFMKEITNGDITKMQFLYQIAGYCLLKKNIFEKFFIFKGEGGTGKSTYTNLLHKMLGGDKNCSHVSLADFDKDYYLATTVGKLLNIDDDVVDGKVLEGTGRFKSFISGNVISVRQIYREVMDFSPFATCIFSCNRLPKIMDKTSGLYRRMVLIELNHKVEKPDPLFMNKITDADMEYFLFKAVEGIMIALEEGRFRITQSEQQLLLLFKRRQNPLNEWLYDTNMTLGDVIGQKCIVLYKQFIEWCGDNGYSKLMTNFTFKEDMCALYGCYLKQIKEDGKPNTQIFDRRDDYDKNFMPF